MEPRARIRGADYFLPFLVVFFAEDFLVVAFFFLAAMALVTSFLVDKCKGGEFYSQRFFARA